MRKLFIVLFAVLTITISLYAQGERKKDLYVGAGVSFPIAPQRFSDYWNAGINLGAGLGWYLTPNVSLITSFEYNHFTLDENSYRDAHGLSNRYTLNGGSVSTLTLFGSAKVIIDPKSREIPYFLAGIGYYHTSTSDLSSYYYISDGGSESTFGMQAGFGIDIPTNEHTSLFIEIKYVLGVTKREATGYIPLRGGFKIAL